MLEITWNPISHKDHYVVYLYFNLSELGDRSIVDIIPPYMPNIWQLEYAEDDKHVLYFPVLDQLKESYNKANPDYKFIDEEKLGWKIGNEILHNLRGDILPHHAQRAQHTSTQHRKKNTTTRCSKLQNIIQCLRMNHKVLLIIVFITMLFVLIS